MKQAVRFSALALCLSIAVGCTEPPNGTTAPAGAPAASNTDVANLKVVNWGPKTTKPGATFNLQPDGKSGLFVELSDNVPMTKFEATLGGKPLTGVVASGKVVTATVPTDYLATPGSFPVELVVPAQNAHITVGNFTVEGAVGASPAATPATGATAPGNAAAGTPAATAPATPTPAAGTATPAPEAAPAGSTAPTP